MWQLNSVGTNWGSSRRHNPLHQRHLFLLSIHKKKGELDVNVHTHDVAAHQQISIQCQCYYHHQHYTRFIFFCSCHTFHQQLNYKRRRIRLMHSVSRSIAVEFFSILEPGEKSIYSGISTQLNSMREDPIWNHWKSMPRRLDSLRKVTCEGQLFRWQSLQ